MTAATYRLQLRGGTDLDAAARLLPYLRDLGVTHPYLSPVARARPGSAHGYDVLDPREVDPALGGQEAWQRLAAEADRLGMGLVVDLVPDHLAAHADNPWWNDLLRHGAASRYAPWFDVDWDAPTLPGRVLLPLLQEPLPDAVASGAVRLALHDEVVVEVAGQRLPLDPASHALLLDGVDEARDLAAAAAALPPRRPEHAGARHEAVRRLDLPGRLADPTLRAAVRRRLDHLNGPDGHGHALLVLGAQAYALAPWREAPRRVRHRRFFDINDLVGIRPHLPDCFDGLHRWVVDEARRGRVHGVRVDHVDGLADPDAYLRMLRDALPPGVPIWVEKITAPDERLPDWPVDGTTGYEAMAHVDALQVDARGLRRLWTVHADRTGRPPFSDLTRRAARHVMEHLFAGILDDLARRLRLALADGDAPPPDAADLREAVAAATAALPVYRTYARDGVRSEDRAVLESALSLARGHAPGAALDALARVLLRPTTDAHRDWLERWQQWSPAVHAKAVEDTALYQAAPLLGLNEVGQEPHRPPLGRARFLRFATDRARGPAGLTATTTHDTKMSGDVRARLHVLSPLADDFVALHRHLLHLVPPRAVGDREVPGPAFAWRLHQTLLGVWPLEEEEPDLDDLRDRLRDHVVKAGREAKLRTDWLEPDEAYEAALRDHADALTRAVAGDGRFLRLAGRVALHGMVNSLAATVLRCTLPGTPDLYQGLESWRFLLVDPDNRRPPDWDRLRRVLAALDAESADPADLLASWPDGRVKTFVTAALLRHRRDRPDLYAGEVEPCRTEGARARNAVATLRGGGLLVVVPRLAAAMDPDAPPVGAAWGDTALLPPPGAPGRWRDVLTGRVHAAAGGRLRLAEVLGALPVAVLERD